MFEQALRIDPNNVDALVGAAVQLCLEGRFDPVLDYLDGLTWDGVSRLDTWLTTYMGAFDAK
jgi:predicted P-loop ATPase